VAAAAASDGDPAGAPALSVPSAVSDGDEVSPNNDEAKGGVSSRAFTRLATRRLTSSTCAPDSFPPGRAKLRRLFTFPEGSWTARVSFSPFLLLASLPATANTPSFLVFFQSGFFLVTTFSGGRQSWDRQTASTT
jgi:hypothetical protein